MVQTNPKYHSVKNYERKTKKCMKIETMDHISRFMAEVVGTGMITSIGCGCCVQWGDEPPSHFQIVFGFGMTIMAIIQIFGHISAAHLNPAITISAFIQKKIDLFASIYYIIAQILGGFVGFGVLKLLTPENILRRPDQTVGTCSTVLHPDVSPIQGLFVEFMCTSVIIFVFCAILDHRNEKNTDSTPLRFGFIIFLLALISGPSTGGSFNPARTLGPAIWNGDWQDHWIYWVGPLAAGVLATYAYKVVFWRPNPADKVTEDIPLENTSSEEKNPA